jgi:asparagine synthetase B (glutamine-hydrolysing)
LLNQYPIPIGKCNYSFQELCHNRIIDLLKHPGEIGILYSGGIDSTLVTALMLQTISPSDRNRITFFYNSASVMENPIFFNNYIRNQFNTGSSWDFDDWLSQSNRIIITGECADNLFGSLTVKSIVNRFDDISILHKPYAPVIEKVWRENLQDDFNDIYEQFLMLSESCPFKITTVNDWFWWLNFTMKWQAVIYRIYSHTDLSKTKGRLVHFFNTDNFQRWSLENPDLKIKNDWKSYKWIMKDIIYEFDHDQDYRDNKVKFPSLPSMLRFKNVTDYISDDISEVLKNNIKLN